MFSPTLSQIFNFPKDVQVISFAPDYASIAFLVENVLMVFYKHKSGLFIPSYKPRIPDKDAMVIKDLDWISPHEIQYSRKQPGICLKKHRDRFLSELGDVVPENYTVCQHFLNKRKCNSCGSKEAIYDNYAANAPIGEAKDNSEKSIAKIHNHGFVTIWTFGNINRDGSVLVPMTVEYEKPSWEEKPTLDKGVLKVDIVYGVGASACTKPTIIGIDCQLSRFGRAGLDKYPVSHEDLYQELMECGKWVTIDFVVVEPLVSGDMLAKELKYLNFCN